MLHNLTCGDSAGPGIDPDSVLTNSDQSHIRIVRWPPNCSPHGRSKSTRSLIFILSPIHRVSSCFQVRGPTKRCRRCGTDRPTSEFHRQQSRPDGLYSYCVFCAAEYKQARKLNRQREQEPLPPPVRFCVAGAFSRTGCGPQ